MAETMYARICAVIVCLGPYKVTFFFFVGGCYRNLDPSGDVFSYAQVVTMHSLIKLKKPRVETSCAGTSINQERIFL